MPEQNRRQIVGDYVIEAEAVQCVEGGFVAHVGVTKVAQPHWKILDWHAKAIAFDSGAAAIEAGLAAGRRWLSGGECR